MSLLMSIDDLFARHAQLLQQVRTHHLNQLGQAQTKHQSHKQELIRLLASCACVITDSGGIQEEANFLGKHIYVLRKVTERNAIAADRITLCGLRDIASIRCDISNHEAGLEYGNGSSCSVIADILGHTN